MQIKLNGEAHPIDSSIRMAELVEQLGLSGMRLAIVLILEILRRSQYADTRLNDGDRVEIVHAIGGG